MKKFLSVLGMMMMIGIVALPIFSIVPAFAQDSAVTPDTKLKPIVIPCPKTSLLPCITQGTQEKGGDSIRTYVTVDFAAVFFKAFLGLSAAATVIFIIVGGIQMHAAVGQEEKLTSAKKTITWAIVGLVLSILSLALIQIISNLNF